MTILAGLIVLAVFVTLCAGGLSLYVGLPRNGRRVAGQVASAEAAFGFLCFVVLIMLRVATEG